MEIDNLGKGAIPDQKDERDYIAETQFGAAPIDWSKPFTLPEPKDSNQHFADDCVAESSSYLHEQLKGKIFSRRDLFCRIFLDYGAQLRDGVKQITEVGQADKKEVPDPAIPTPQNMRDSTGTKQEYRDDDKEANYFVVKQNSIDGVAQAVRDYQGAIFGVYGTNKGWADKDHPTPPNSLSDSGLWSHAIYAYGYHLDGGQKCIIAKSSWCSGTHKRHHIKENYFIKGMTFNAWCVIPKEEQFMTNSILVKRGTEYGFYDPATSADGLITMMRIRGIKPPLKEDGQLDWASVDNLLGGAVVDIK